MFATLLALLLLASPLGLWVSGAGADMGEIEIGACGAGFCGRLVDAARLRVDPDQRDVRNHDPALRGRRLHGLVVLKDFEGGPPVWTGEAYDPKTGYGARGVKLRLLSPARLQVKGCLAVFCRTELMTRAR